MTGDYARLRSRAQEKAARMEGPRAGRAPSDAGIRAALEWYFDRHAMPVPAALGAWAAEAGWAEEHDFIRAVWEDYLFENGRS